MDDAYTDENEEKLINEEYKVWKKNTPFLYGGSCVASQHVQEHHRPRVHYSHPATRWTCPASLDFIESLASMAILFNILDVLFLHSVSRPAILTRAARV